MEKIKKIGKILYNIYVAIGMLAVAIMAGCVIYAVIARYCFNISHRPLEEFITTIFAFTTFWGMGICSMEGEHVAIDSVFNAFPKKLKTFLTFFNYVVTLVVLYVMLVFGAKYAFQFGKQISFGMRVPMVWMYGIIPVGCFLCMICVVVKLFQKIFEVLQSKAKKEEA